MINIDKKVLEEHSITLPQLLLMMLSLEDVNIPKLVDEIVNLNLGVHNPRDSYELIPTNKTKNMVNSILIESNKTVLQQKDRFENLAVKLQELFPKGVKPGTSYTWRDSKMIIAKRLKMLVKKYGDCFTDEEAIDATKRYIEHFNGDTTYMQLLKYFILKNSIKDGVMEETSQLLSYIENKDANTKDSTDDWTSYSIN